MSPERQGQVAPQHWWHQQQRPHSRIPLYPKRDRSALGADRSPKPSPEGPGWGEWSWPDAERSPWRRLPPTPGRPAGGGGIELTLSSVSEDSEEEEADTLTERAERAGEGDRPLPRFPPKWDLSLPDECLRRFSRREDSLARSHLPGKTVAEAAPAGGTTTGAGTLADKQATWAADVTGAAGPGSTPALVTPATKTPQPHPAIPQARPVSARCWPLTQTQSRRARLRGVVMARRWAVTLTATTTNARTPSGGRRHRTNPLFCIRRLRRRGGRHTHRTGRESRGRGPTPATLSTQMGPLSTRRVPAALL